MNSLDDLRTTLTARADSAVSADGLDVVSRNSQVHRRVRTVRRRRAIAGGVAALAVVTAGTAIALPSLLGERSDRALVAERTVLGDVAPAERTALGLTYTFDRATSTEATALTVTPERVDDVAPLLSWTTSDEDARITVTGDGVEGDVLWTSTLGEFTDHVVLDQWEGGPVTITSSTPGVGVAAYTFDPDAQVPGTAGHGVTFRDPVAGRALLAADIKDRVRSVTVPFEADGPQLTIATYCSGVPDEGGEVGTEVLLNGEVVSWGGGCSDQYIPGSDLGHVTLTPDPGDLSGTLEIRLSRGAREPRSFEGTVPEDAVLGVAVYEAAQFVEVGEMVTDETFELNGHVWSVATTERRDGPGVVGATLEGDGPFVVRAVKAGRLTNSFEAWGTDFGLSVDGVLRAVSGSSDVRGGMVSSSLMLPEGASALSLDAREAGVEESALIVYTVAD